MHRDERPVRLVVGDSSHVRNAGRRRQGGGQGGEKAEDSQTCLAPYPSALGSPLAWIAARSAGGRRRLIRSLRAGSRLPGVRFVTAEDLPVLYADPARAEGVDRAAIERLARETARAKAADAVEVAPGRFLSAAEGLAGFRT